MLARSMKQFLLAATLSSSLLTNSVHSFPVTSSLTTKLHLRLPIASSVLIMSMSSVPQDDGQYYRSDGVRITHDPYAPGMAEKYGIPGSTDPEGFDPIADTVRTGEP